MSDLEKLVRRRMHEEYAKGSSAEEIAKVVRDIFNSTDLSGAVAARATTDHG
jgi:hypothetical protein